MGLKKPHRRNTESGMLILMGGTKVGKMSVQSKLILCGEMGKDMCPHFIQPFIESMN